MKKPASVQALEELGRVKLSKHFFMRDFLYSEISQIEGIPNIPDYPDRAIEAGRGLCENLLEPLQERFGRIAIRSAYRSSAVNAKGAEDGNNCAKNESNYASHIWDYLDAEGHLGATACIVVPACCPGTTNIKTGRHWPGGSMTTCRMPASTGSPNWRRSTCAGVAIPMRSPASAPTSIIRTRAIKKPW